MRFMLIRKADPQTEQGVLPSQELLAAMADYNARMVEAGVFVDGNGLRPSTEGARVEFHNGEPVVIDGPFAETKELLAGYSVLEVDSLAEAIAWAKQWPTLDSNGNARLELRPYFSLADFEPGQGLAQHQQLAKVPDGMNVHLAFAGNCREAMAFYAEVTGGELEQILTYGETPAAADVPASLHDRIIHASLNLRGRKLMGADMQLEDYEPPRGMQVQLDYKDPEQAARTFDALAAGGKIFMPLAQTFFAYRFGMLTDRFGINWMINCTQDKSLQSA